MRNVIVVGTGSAQLSAALRLLAVESQKLAVEMQGFTTLTLSSDRMAGDLNHVSLPGADDPFQGGRRSKGEKKRAAKERRMRSGR